MPRGKSIVFLHKSLNDFINNICTFITKIIFLHEKFVYNKKSIFDVLSFLVHLIVQYLNDILKSNFEVLKR